ncbi:MAG: hypothetical protein CEN87_121 [Parcubacteria group bacterium Licking1014_1]|nr:MAG: hypothetical protein CEN87_121 [Parcubacteria group bacterium Licking1014_1]
MESIGWWMIVVLVVMAVLLIIMAIATKNWYRAIPFGVGAFALFAGAVILEVMTSKMSCPAPVGQTEVEKDFYQVSWEEETTEGTTLVVAKDNSGNFYLSEFNEPLGVKKFLVVKEGKFKPLRGLLEKKNPPSSKK